MKRDEAGCVVPMRAEIKTGTLSGILKQAGVSVEEFIEALGR
jgi:predicted RNA binding protein YcfA (HicA-like mRNA interferase family)